MAELVLLVSAVVTGLFLAGVAFAISQLGARRSYRPTFAAAVPGGGGTARDSREALPRGVKIGVLVLVVAGIVGGSVLFLDAVGTFVVLLGAVLVGYLTWGVYYMSRARGLPVAHSVGMSAFILGMLLIAGIAGKLLLG